MSQSIGVATIYSAGSARTPVSGLDFFETELSRESCTT